MQQMIKNVMQGKDEGADNEEENASASGKTSNGVFGRVKLSLDLLSTSTATGIFSYHVKLIIKLANVEPVEILATTSLISLSLKYFKFNQFELNVSFFLFYSKELNVFMFCWIVFLSAAFLMFKVFHLSSSCSKLLIALCKPKIGNL